MIGAWSIGTMAPGAGGRYQRPGKLDIPSLMFDGDNFGRRVVAKLPKVKVDINILKQSIDRQAGRTDRNRFRDKFRTTAVTVFTAFAGATTATLIGLSKYVVSLEDWLQAVALIISGILSVVVAWDHLFDHKRLWIISSKGNRQFLRLKEDISHTEATGTLTEELSQEFYSRYNEILDSMNGEWDRLRGQRGG